jgi:hypothetical protein
LRALAGHGFAKKVGARLASRQLKTLLSPDMRRCGGKGRSKVAAHRRAPYAVLPTLRPADEVGGDQPLTRSLLPDSARIILRLLRSRRNKRRSPNSLRRVAPRDGPSGSIGAVSYSGCMPPISSYRIYRAASRASPCGNRAGGPPKQGVLCRGRPRPVGPHPDVRYPDGPLAHRPRHWTNGLPPPMVPVADLRPGKYLKREP